jgi:hypothetical protein
MKAIIVLLILECFVLAEDNKIISGIKKKLRNRIKKKRIFNTLPVVRGCRLGDNL